MALTVPLTDREAQLYTEIGRHLDTCDDAIAACRGALANLRQPAPERTEMVALDELRPGDVVMVDLWWRTVVAVADHFTDGMVTVTLAGNVPPLTDKGNHTIRRKAA